MEVVQKAYLEGTHRVCQPEETLERIVPMLSHFGVTRLADVTWLDEIGLPVYQAVRPDSYLLSVSQGKGITPPLAQVSALMESIEIWHAEQLAPGAVTATLGEIEGALDYCFSELPALLPRNHLNLATRLTWTQARHLISGRETLVPSEYVCVDSRVSETWTPKLFDVSTNGLASGNSFTEAVLHALYEVIERDAIVRAGGERAKRILDPRTVDGNAAWVIERLTDNDVEFVIEVFDSPTGVPVFRSSIVSDLFPTVFVGSGAHLDRDVALCRALTEAVQSRVTCIAGARDDMDSNPYRRSTLVRHGHAAAPDLEGDFAVAERVPFQDIPSLAQPTLAQDLTMVTEKIYDFTGRDPMVVDHTRLDVMIPVVGVICPQLLFDNRLV